jgi:hypothetical protein
MSYDEITEITAGIVRTGNYQPGDVFQEMYHYWMYVVRVNEDKVVMLEGNPGEFPKGLINMNLNTYTKEELNKKLRYNNVSDRCWIDYQKNDKKLTDRMLVDYVRLVNESGNVEKIRDMNINLILC